MATLAGPDERLRAMAATHVLPLPIKQHPEAALAALLDALLARAADPAAAPASTDVAAALVATLKGARAANLLVALQHSVAVGDRSFMLPAALLETAVVHAQEAVRCVCGHSRVERREKAFSLRRATRGVRSPRLSECPSWRRAIHCVLREPTGFSTMLPSGRLTRSHI